MTQKSRRNYTCPICAGSMIEDVPAAQPFAWLYGPKVGDGPKERRLTFVDPDSWGTTLGLEVIPLYAMPDPRIAELEELLERCRVHTYNAFEPDNQSRLHKDIAAALNKEG